MKLAVLSKFQLVAPQIEHISTDRQIADLLTKGLGESAFLPLRDLLMGWAPRKLLDHKGELNESGIRPREIPSPKDSVFLANMRSHQKVFHRLAEFGKMPREPGANFPEGVENDLRSTENSQNESHLQDHFISGWQTFARECHEQIIHDGIHKFPQ